VSPQDQPELDNPYLAVFNKPKSKYKPEKYSISDFSNFKEDMLFRSSLIKNAFMKSDAKVIIGIGGAAGYKKAALEVMFGNNIFTPIPFTVDMRNKKGQSQKAFLAKVNLENKILHIFLIPFPNAGQGFISQENALSMLEELYEKFLSPILHSK
jgi:hypothetical protein